MTRLLHTKLILTSLLFAAHVYAESDDGGLLDFSIDGSNATITGFTAGTSTVTLNIPATVSTGGNSYSVTSIRSYAFLSNKLTSVTIPNSVTRIGTSAFSSNQLTSITIPDNLTSIEVGAFSNNRLTSVIIPDSVTYIGVSAFLNNKLTSVTIPTSVTSIGTNAFFGNQLTSVFIPNSVTSIRPGAFSNNILTSVTIPNSVVELSGFENNQLASIMIPDSVLDLSGFGGNQLTTVTIPESVTSIGDHAFRNNALISVIIPYSVTSIYNHAFSDNKITSVLFKADYSDRIGSSIFIGNPDLTTIQACNNTSDWDGKSFSNGDSDVSVTVIDCSSTDSVVPDIPQQSLSKIVRTDGKSTDSTISIGSSSDNGETYSTSFTTDDEIILTAKIYPDSNDLGEEGELYVVIRTTENDKKVFKALNEDGVWEVWNASLKSLPAAKYVESLESVEKIEIYSGSMTAGQRLIYVGYSLFTDGKPVITTSLSPLKIDVSE